MSAAHESPRGLATPVDHPIARILLIAFAAVQLFLAATGKRHGITGPDLVAFVLITGSATAVVLLRESRLSRRVVVSIVLALVAASGVLTPTLSIHGNWPGYAAWHFGAITFVALALAVRHQIAAAWWVMAGQSAIAIGWSVATGQGALYGLNLVDRQAGTLIIGTLFAIGLRRAARSAQELQAVAQRKAAAEQASDASTNARRASVSRVLNLAGSALSTIRDDPNWTDADLADFASIEGRLRDDIRFPGFATDRLTESADAARRRGVDVVLLNDTAVAFDGMIAARRWLAVELDRTDAGPFTGRVHHDSEGLRVTAVTAAGSAESHISVAESQNGDHGQAEAWAYGDPASFGTIDIQING